MPRTSPKRRTQAPEIGIEERRCRVAELALKGRSQREIAVLMGVSQPTVSKDLIFANQEWRTRRVAAVQSRIDRIIASFDLQRIEAWDAWERSKVPSKTTSVTKESVLRGGKKVAAGDDEEEANNEDTSKRKRGRPAKYKKDDEGKLVLIKETLDESLKTGAGDVSFLNFIKSLDLEEAKIIGAIKDQTQQNNFFTFDFTKLYKRPVNDDDMDDVEEQIRRVEEMALPAGNKLLTQEESEPVESLSNDEVERIMQRTLNGG